MSGKLKIVRNKGEGIAKKRRINKGLLKENMELYSIVLPSIILILIFSYIPLYGLIISFQNYTPGSPFFSLSEKIDWVGLKHFLKFINGPYFGRIMGNTLILSLLNLVFGFPIPIIFALLLNEVRTLKFKKFVQTASYLPYFISTVVVASMVLSFIGTDGIVNNILAALGGGRKNFITEPQYFRGIYTFTNIWKSFGFNSILYISAISGVDQEMYESARLDGANRLQSMWYITLPSIKPTIAMTLILALGGVMASNTDLVLLLYSPSTYVTADVIGTYSYRVGIQGGQFSYTTAIGLFSAIINFILVFVANKTSDKLADASLF